MSAIGPKPTWEGAQLKSASDPLADMTPGAAERSVFPDFAAFLQPRRLGSFRRPGKAVTMAVVGLWRVLCGGAILSSSYAAHFRHGQSWSRPSQSAPSGLASSSGVLRTIR